MTTETLAALEHKAVIEAATICQLVTFFVDDEVFAVDMGVVQEIIRMPSVVRVPLAAPALEGLANLRGKVLPMVSLRRMLGFKARAYNEATRAVVIDLGQSIGFVVDRVASVLSVDSSKIAAVDETLRSTINSQWLSGQLKNMGGHKIIMVLDFEKLIASEFSQLSQAISHAPLVNISDLQEVDEPLPSDERQLVCFVVAGQEYAIVIDDVEETVPIPAHIVHVPHSQAHVLGMMTLRNRLLPLVSLRRMFDLPQYEANEHSRIVVVALGDVSVGVVIDSVNEVLRVAKIDMDTLPVLLARDGDLSDITEVCKLDEGRRLVSIISVAHLFSHSAIKEALSTVDNLHEGLIEQRIRKEHDERISETDEQVVIFRLGTAEFGVPIETVQEIVRVPDELTQVPRAPAFVQGVINLRGVVLPVIDQRLRLGLMASERNDRQRIMVFLFNGVRTGFMVDSVTEVLKIPKKAIENAPHLSDEQSRLIGRVANLEQQQRLIQLIDPSQLIESQELSGLTQLMV